MTQEKANYKAAMAELREICPPENQSLLSQVDRYTGHLRREKASLSRHIDELKRTVAAKEAQIDDLRPLQRLHGEIARLEKSKDRLEKQRDQLRQVVKDWQEIEEKKSNFVKVKAKCLKCSLHFIVCTWSPERHTAQTLVCPECGQHRGQFLVWKEVPSEALIYQAVPGTTPLSGVGPMPNPERN